MFIVKKLLLIIICVYGFDCVQCEDFCLPKGKKKMSESGDAMTISSLRDVPFLCTCNVKIKDQDAVINKLNDLVISGKSKLQVITDYDLTLTKQHSNGKRTLSSFGLLAQCKNLPSGFLEKDRALVKKYYPIERDVNMSNEEKQPHILAWYNESQTLFTGVQYDVAEVDRIIEETGPELREGTVAFCRSLESHGIPVLVLSAGLGNVLTQVLDHHQLYGHSLFHVVSNFFKIEDGVIKGFGCQENGEFLHPLNKNGLGCSEYFKRLGSSRGNVLILGDSLGDAAMDQGVPEIRTSLKIGFLYGTEAQVAEGLPKFLNNFDIVLIDDQTMSVPQGILDLILK